MAEEQAERRRITVRGIVQGVGFRPFVYRHALRLGLYGFVLNSSAGVVIEVEGRREALEAFQHALLEDAPPLARIDEVLSQSLRPQGDTAFVIAHSQAGAERSALISPDTATCPDCLREILDAGDRRYGYPFTNCTNCGPRFTIVQDVPYDRAYTTMNDFQMCPACQAEYDNPLDRRFHAQPNACPTCGPSLLGELFREDGAAELEPVTVEWAARQLAGGAILAIKGLGGYHLACNALDPEAVGRLRRRKRREAKPFALMPADAEVAGRLCFLSEAEAELLQSHRRPIVLLKKRPDCPVAHEVAPDYDNLGVMLPYTPLHHLLMHAFAERRAGQPAVLVMTSGNLSDEPIAYKDDEARSSMPSIADGMLAHNRGIHMRCDDSVVRIAAGGEQLFRRSRGYAPAPVQLPLECPVPILACGGHLKNTFALCKGRQAFISHHIGDLENLETLTSFREGIQHFGRLFDIQPQAVAYDLHPEYMASKYALETDVPQKIGVQHHHAHIASVIAEHRLDGPVIGVAADGTGYGTDGAIWGCEIMQADLHGFRRMSHLRYVPLPGGEGAVRRPWRMAAAYLSQAYGDDFLKLDIPFVQRLDMAHWRPLSQMIERKLNCPPTSSLGRLFDAVASLLGVRDEALYEGQAAIEMEMQAEPDTHSYPFAIQDGSPATLDAASTIRAVVEDIQRGVSTPRIAGRFHRTMAEMLAAACKDAREENGLNRVALSGGVFQNRLLLEQLSALLQESGFEVFINRLVPPNDGGLSLGQAAVAAQLLV